MGNEPSAPSSGRRSGDRRDRRRDGGGRSSLRRGGRRRPPSPSAVTAGGEDGSTCAGDTHTYTHTYTDGDDGDCGGGGASQAGDASTFGGDGSTYEDETRDGDASADGAGAGAGDDVDETRDAGDTSGVGGGGGVLAYLFCLGCDGDTTTNAAMGAESSRPSSPSSRDRDRDGGRRSSRDKRIPADDPLAIFDSMCGPVAVAVFGERGGGDKDGKRGGGGRRRNRDDDQSSIGAGTFSDDDRTAGSGEEDDDTYDGDGGGGGGYRGKKDAVSVGDSSFGGTETTGDVSKPEGGGGKSKRRGRSKRRDGHGDDDDTYDGSDAEDTANDDVTHDDGTVEEEDDATVEEEEESIVSDNLPDRKERDRDRDREHRDRRRRGERGSSKRGGTGTNDDGTSGSVASNSVVTSSDVPSLMAMAKPLASSFAKRCYFTKSGIGKTTQHYEGLTLTGNVVLMLAGAMKLKGCPTICDEDLRRVEQTYPNQFSRLPDELLLSSGWRRISKYCHFSHRPVPDGVPFFHSKRRCHPQTGGYYFLLASAVGMVRPIDVEPLTIDTLVVLETDYPRQCDAAPEHLVQQPDAWTLVNKFCFFSGGPINADEDVYYRADFDGNAIFMLAFLSPSLTPEELYRLGNDKKDGDADGAGDEKKDPADPPTDNDGADPPALRSVAAVEEVESVYDLTERDFDDLRLYHLGPCRALPPYVLRPEAWAKVLPPRFVAARERAMERARKWEEKEGGAPADNAAAQQQWAQQQQQQQQQMQAHTAADGYVEFGAPGGGGGGGAAQQGQQHQQTFSAPAEAFTGWYQQQNDWGQQAQQAAQQGEWAQQQGDWNQQQQGDWAQQQQQQQQTPGHYQAQTAMAAAYGPSAISGGEGFFGMGAAAAASQAQQGQAQQQPQHQRAQSQPVIGAMDQQYGVVPPTPPQDAAGAFSFFDSAGGAAPTAQAEQEGQKKKQQQQQSTWTSSRSKGSAAPWGADGGNNGNGGGAGGGEDPAAAEFAGRLRREAEEEGAFASAAAGPIDEAAAARAAALPAGAMGDGDEGGKNAKQQQQPDSPTDQAGGGGGRKSPEGDYVDADGKIIVSPRYRNHADPPPGSPTTRFSHHSAADIDADGAKEAQEEEAPPQPMDPPDIDEAGGAISAEEAAGEPPSLSINQEEPPSLSQSGYGSAFGRPLPVPQQQPISGDGPAYGPAEDDVPEGESYESYDKDGPEGDDGAYGEPDYDVPEDDVGAMGSPPYSPDDASGPYSPEEQHGAPRGYGGYNEGLGGPMPMTAAGMGGGGYDGYRGYDDEHDDVRDIDDGYPPPPGGEEMMEGGEDGYYNDGSPLSGGEGSAQYRSEGMPLSPAEDGEMGMGPGGMRGVPYDDESPPRRGGQMGYRSPGEEIDDDYLPPGDDGLSPNGVAGPYGHGRMHTHMNTVQSPPEMEEEDASYYSGQHGPSPSRGAYQGPPLMHGHPDAGGMMAMQSRHYAVRGGGSVQNGYTGSARGAGSEASFESGPQSMTSPANSEANSSAQMSSAMRGAQELLKKNRQKRLAMHPGRRHPVTRKPLLPSSHDVDDGMGRSVRSDRESVHSLRGGNNDFPPSPRRRTAAAMSMGMGVGSPMMPTPASYASPHAHHPPQRSPLSSMSEGGGGPPGASGSPGEPSLSPSPRSDTSGGWDSASGTDVTASSVWTDTTDPNDRTSRRAIILQMAKARMKKKQQQSGSQSVAGRSVDAESVGPQSHMSHHSRFGRGDHASVMAGEDASAARGLSHIHEAEVDGPGDTEFYGDLD